MVDISQAFFHYQFVFRTGGRQSLNNKESTYSSSAIPSLFQNHNYIPDFIIQFGQITFTDAPRHTINKGLLQQQVELNHGQSIFNHYNLDQFLNFSISFCEKIVMNSLLKVHKNILVTTTSNLSHRKRGLYRLCYQLPLEEKAMYCLND